MKRSGPSLVEKLAASPEALLQTWVRYQLENLRSLAREKASEAEHGTPDHSLTVTRQLREIEGQVPRLLAAVDNGQPWHAVQCALSIGAAAAQAGLTHALFKMEPDANRGRKDRRDRSKGGRTGGRGRAKDPAARVRSNDELVEAVRQKHEQWSHLNWTAVTDSVADDITEEGYRISGSTVRKKAQTARWYKPRKRRQESPAKKLAH